MEGTKVSCAGQNPRLKFYIELPALPLEILNLSGWVLFFRSATLLRRREGKLLAWCGSPLPP